MDDYAEFVRGRREILGMSQRELAARSGVKQPYIAAIERGRRLASPTARASLDAALRVRPSVALRARRSQVADLFADASLAAPRVFGSVARGDDDEASDLDLLVEFTDRHDIADLLELQDRLRRLLTMPVDLVDARAEGRVVHRAVAEAVPL